MLGERAKPRAPPGNPNSNNNNTNGSTKGNSSNGGTDQSRGGGNNGSDDGDGDSDDDDDNNSGSGGFAKFGDTKNFPCQFVNENDGRLQYMGTWVLESKDPNGIYFTTHTTSTAGSEVAISFNGTLRLLKGYVLLTYR